MRRGPVRVSLLAAGPHERPAVVGCVLVRCTDSPCANSQKYRKVMITRSLGSKVIMGYLRASIKINQDQSRSTKINQASIKPQSSLKPSHDPGRAHHCRMIQIFRACSGCMIPFDSS